jgi:hypothetical protein
MTHKLHLTPDQRAEKQPKSLKLAIAAFCYQCQGADDEHPNLTKARVRDCKVVTCRLWRHRGWRNISTKGLGNLDSETLTPALPGVKKKGDG